jgi:hypothetical protein
MPNLSCKRRDVNGKNCDGDSNVGQTGSPSQCLCKVFASRRLLASLSGRADRYSRGFFIKKFDDSTNHPVFSHHAGENLHPEGAMHLGKMLDSGSH